MVAGELRDRPALQNQKSGSHPHQVFHIISTLWLTLISILSNAKLVLRLAVAEFGLILVNTSDADEASKLACCPRHGAQGCSRSLSSSFIAAASPISVLCLSSLSFLSIAFHSFHITRDPTVMLQSIVLLGVAALAFAQDSSSITSSASVTSSSSASTSSAANTSSGPVTHTIAVAKVSTHP